MKICRNCGKRYADNVLFCEECGSRVETEPEQNTTYSVLQAKAAELTQPLMKKEEEEEKEKQKAAVPEQVISENEMWSWLKKDSKKHMFFTDEVNTLGASDYAGYLNQKLQSSYVPATVEMRKIQWDRSPIQNTEICVRLATKMVNPLACVIQFNHIGKYTFVEEKTFIAPPVLPPVPEKRKPIPSRLLKERENIRTGIMTFLLGVLTAVVGIELVPIILIIVGFVLALIGFNAQGEIDRIELHNMKCEEQEIAWNTAWNNWEDTIFIHTFREGINGQIARIYDAVFDSIKKLNDELFNCRASEEQQESQGLNELEQIVARRKDEYK